MMRVVRVVFVATWRAASRSQDSALRFRLRVAIRTSRAIAIDATPTLGLPQWYPRQCRLQVHVLRGFREDSPAHRLHMRIHRHLYTLGAAGRMLRLLV